MSSSLDFRSRCGHAAFVVLFAGLLPVAAVAQSAQVASFSSQNGSFIENRGQLFDQHYHTIPNVHYYYDGRGVRLYVDEHSLHFIFSKSEGNKLDRFQSPPVHDTTRPLTLYRTDLSFVGSNAHPRIEALDKKESYDNYYLPTCPNGLTHVPEFGTIIYHDLYPHIDMELIAEGPVAKYEFIVHPGGDPAQIRMLYDCREHISIEEDGSLHISNPFGEIEEPKPFSFQSEDPVRTNFLVEGNRIRFVVGTYDKTRDLVIDPPRMWGTYYGGAGQDDAAAVATDTAGNVYVTGITTSTAGIATAGAFQTSYEAANDIFLVKFNSSGVRQWGTYAGGLGFDGAAAIVVDHNEDIVIAGTTESYTLISTTGAYQTTFGGESDAFLMKFTSAGARSWGTYYGSISWDRGFAVGVDPSNNIYLGGTVNGYNNFGNALVAKFNSAGTSLSWATTWGGNNPVAGDAVLGLTLDNSSNCYVIGAVNSTYSFATTGAHQTTIGGSTDAFLAKLSSAGAIGWCTYYGGSLTDYGQGISTDGTYLYATGWTSSSSNIATSGAFLTTFAGSNMAFLSKWSLTGSLIWGTYYGAGLDIGNAVAVDSNDDIVFTGSTASSSGIATTGEYQTTYLNNGIQNAMAFLAKFKSSGSRQWGTYYGTGDEEVGNGVAIDPKSDILLAGYTGTSGGSLASTGAQQTTPGGGGQDAFIAKFCGIIRPAIVNSGHDTLCYGNIDTLTAPSGYSTYQWTLNGSNISGATSQKYVTSNTLAAGSYQYGVGVTNPEGCSISSFSQNLVIHANPTATAGVNRTICAGDTTLLGGAATGGKRPYQYSWTPITGLDHPDSAAPRASPTSSTTYTVIVTDSNGCQDSKNVTVTVNPVPALSYPQQVETCSNAPIQIGGTASGALAPYVYSWFPSTGLSSTNTAQPTANPTTTTKYFDTITDANGCHSLDSVSVTVDPAPVLSLTPSVGICAGSSVTLSTSTTSGTGSMSYNWSPTAGLSSATVPNPVASPANTTTYTASVTDSKGCTVSKQVVVTVHPLPTPVITENGRPLTICQGDTLTLSTQNPYMNYEWSDGESSSTIAVTHSGTYSVTVLDAFGCQGNSSSVAVQVNALPEASVNGPTSACPGEAANYSAIAFPNDLYSWKANGGTVASGAASSACSVNWQTVGTQTLTLTVTDTATGCSNDTTLTVNVSSQLTPTVALSGSTTLCTGDSLILTAPAGYANYKWSDGETSPTIVVKQSGNYSVQVTSSGGCTGSSTPIAVTAVNQPRPNPTIAASVTTICAGDTAVLTAHAGFTNYLWSDGSAKDTLYVTKAGTYSVTVTNASGCQATSAPVTIQVLPSPTATINASGPTTFCEGGSVTLSAPSGFSSYTWSNGANGASQVVTTSGTYAVTVQNSSGCSRTSQPVVVTVNPVPNPVISGPIAVCANSTSTYSVANIAGSTITWTVTGGTIQNGQGTNSIAVQWGAVGSGSVNADQTVTATACSASAPNLAVTIGSSLKPQVTTGGKTVLCGSSDSVVLDAGAGYASYLWSTGDKSQAITVRSAGKYAVTVGDGSGCSGTSDSIIITTSQPPAVSVIPAGPLTLCAGEYDTLDAGAGFASYSWSKDGSVLPGQTGEQLAVSSAGSYVATVSNSGGCTATSPAVNVTVNQAPARPNITPSNDTLISSAARGYQWSLSGVPIPQATGQTFVPDTIGNYTVTVVDSNGCSATSLPFAVTSGGSTVIGVPAMVVAQQSDHVVIPLSILSSQNLPQGANRSYTLVLRFNKTLLIPDGPTVSEVEQGNDLVTTYTGTSSTTQGVLANLGFTAALGNDSCTTVTIDSFAWGTPNILVTKTNGTFCLSGLCEQGGTRLIIPDGQLGLSDPVPNPTPDEVEIDYQTLEHGRTVLAVCDLLGHEVLRLVDADLPPGSYSVLANVSMLSSGSYYYSLRTPSQVLTKRLEVVR